MNGPEHYAIVDLAFQVLGRGPAAVWSPLHDQVRATCVLPDEQALPLLRRATGPWRHYFPARLPRFNFEQRERCVRAFLPANGFYARQVIRALRAGDVAEAARFAGVYSHYVGDFAQPAHYYELEIGTLLPPPPFLRNCNYHRMIEDIPCRVRTLATRPRLLGTTVAEFEWRLASRYAELYRLSVAAVIPMVRAVYRRRHEPARRVLDTVVRAAAQLFADFCYTAAAIARREFPAADLRQLRTCDLRLIEADAYDVEFNFGHRPLVDVVSIAEYGPAVPFRLRHQRGGEAVDLVTKGLCLIPHALPLPGVTLGAMIEYRLPPRTFDRFTAWVGLLAGYERQARCRFSVQVDGQELFGGPEVGPGDCAQSVAVDLVGRRRLQLRVVTDGSTDQLAFPIWGLPRLHRRPALGNRRTYSTSGP